MKHCVLFIFFILVCHHEAAAQMPSFKCTKQMSKIENKICRDLYLAALDGLMGKIYSFKYTIKDDQQRWLKKISIESNLLTNEYEKRVAEMFKDLIVQTSNKPSYDLIVKELGSINTKNIFKYIYTIQGLEEKKKITDIHLELQEPINLYWLSNAENLLIEGLRDGHHPEISYHILDLDNDGRLDLVKSELMGSARIPVVTNYCLNKSNIFSEGCQSNWDNFSKTGKIKAETSAESYIGHRVYQLGDRNITDKGYFITSDKVTKECSPDWIKYETKNVQTDRLFNEVYRIGEYLKECKDKEQVKSLLVKLAIKAEMFEECRSLIGSTKKSNHEVESHRKECFFTKLTDEEIRTMSFVDICKTDNKVLSTDIKYLLSSVFDSFYTDGELKRDPLGCQRAFDKIQKNKKIKLVFCGIGDVDSFKFLSKFPKVDSLEIIEGGQNVCDGSGIINMKDISVIEDLKIKKLDISLYSLGFEEKKDFWDYLKTTNIAEVNFNGDYFCEYTVKDNTFKRWLFINENNKTKFTCDSIKLKK